MEMIEAARLDGASHFKIYWYIALRTCAGTTTITLAILTFMKTWGNFAWPLIVSAAP